MTGTGVVLRVHPVVVTVVTRLWILGIVELLPRIEVPLPDMACLVPRFLQQFRIGDLAGPQVGFMIAGKVTPYPVPMGVRPVRMAERDGEHTPAAE